MRRLIIVMFLALGASGSHAQGYVDQDRVAPVLNSQNVSTKSPEKITWTVYDYKAYKTGDKKGPWTTLKSYLDSLPGMQPDLRLEIVELANRVTSDKLKTGRYLVVPSSFPDDYRAYSPYPQYYGEAASMDKLLIVDKYTQTFGAYENGNLVRWGLVSTGRTDNLTPDGKYRFTWKTEYRESAEAPEGEVWEMRWVFNFEPRTGLHVHQYSLPIAEPASHGCVRMSMADAMWNYNWAQSSAEGKSDGTPVWVINNNPVDKAAHWYIDADNNVVSLVRLPGEDAYVQSR